MAKRKKNSHTDKKPVLIGTTLFVLALLIIVSLITNNSADNAVIHGFPDSDINPFKTSYNNQVAIVGAFISFFLLSALGWLAYFIPLGLVVMAFRLFNSEVVGKLQIKALIILAVSLLATMIYNIDKVKVPWTSGIKEPAGGFITEKLTELFIIILGKIGSYIILGGAVLIMIFAFTSLSSKLSFNITRPKFSFSFGFLKTIIPAIKSFFSFKWLFSFFESNDNTEDFDDDFSDLEEPSKSDEPIRNEIPESVSEKPAKTKIVRKKPEKIETADQLQLSSVDYKYPTLDLLTENPYTEATVGKDELEFTSRMLNDTLETFGVRIEGEIKYYPGPIITRYEFKPGSGIKINQIVNLADDLALALKAKRIRIIAPIPGKAAVGVEIPNRVAHMVYLRDVLSSPEFLNAKLKLPLALGKTISGKPFVADLAKMPHLLVAGATGSGKSVGMNVMITSLLYRLHPHQIRFIFIDPKMLELSVYSGIPHLGRPVVTKPKRAEKVLTDAVVEMERRYRKLANASVRNIDDFNNKQTNDEEKLPYIVICVDELADLMMSATSSKIEMLITRLAQMSRAVGIHLILATQRPSVDVITGLIKANFPSRIAFQVSTKVDSRTIIDGNGAEKLLGNGDMLFLETGQPESRRIHGAFLSSDETEKIVGFIKDQGIEMMALESISQSVGEPSETEIDMGDPLFKEACEVVIRHKQGSVSLLQRRLGIGYQRAARLIDKLEQAGIVSPFDGSKARDVLVDKTYLETLFANSSAASNPTLFDSDKN